MESVTGSFTMVVPNVAWDSQAMLVKLLTAWRICGQQKYDLRIRSICGGAQLCSAVPVLLSLVFPSAMIVSVSPARSAVKHKKSGEKWFALPGSGRLRCGENLLFVHFYAIADMDIF